MDRSVGRLNCAGNKDVILVYVKLKAFLNNTRLILDEVAMWSYVTAIDGDYVRPDLRTSTYLKGIYKCPELKN